MVVDGEAQGYFAILADYIHLNPVRAYLVRPEDRLVDYRWSSYPAYVTGRDRPPWMETARVLGEVGVEDTPEGRRRYAKRMRERAVATLSGEDGADRERLRRSWCLGGDSFRERMLAMIEKEDAGAQRLENLDSGRALEQSEVKNIRVAEMLVNSQPAPSALVCALQNAQR